VSQLAGTVLFVLQVAAAKLTKPVWLIILGAAVLLITRTGHPKWERIKTDGYDVATLLPLQRDYPWSACRRPRFLASVVWGQWLQQRWIRESFIPNQVPRLWFTGTPSGIASRSASHRAGTV
jgi:hypothetical protein